MTVSRVRKYAGQSAGEALRQRSSSSRSLRPNPARTFATSPLSSTLQTTERPAHSVDQLPLTSGVLNPAVESGGRRGELGVRGFGAEAKVGAGGLQGLVGRTPDVHEPRPYSTRLKSQPQMDELNTLLRHPALYDPILIPRFPIVLCHGLYGFDVRGPAFFRLHYWSDLLKILRGTLGAEVFVTAVPGTGAVKQRAHVLHDSLRENPAVLGRDLNFIAHSMGGLDARYLLSNIHPTTYHPRSLTTLSTPHRGSEFMAWCRANIGIGTDFDKTSEAAARATHEDTSFPLPFSLKAPILSRSQVEASRLASEARKKAKDAAARVKEGSFPGLPYSLSTSLSGYLLDLLDSPAYANLTPSFLRDVFNPSTPNRNDIHYYSVAARTDKIGIWHPLWLPKLVLDGAESARAAQGNATPPQWRGNDGLVNVESSKWGTFLGTLDNCDHWELRGSSGLINAAATAKAVAEGVGLVPEQGKEGSKMKSWQWQDVYALVGKSKSGKEPTPPAPALSEAKRELESDNAKVLASLATWITRRLPLPNSTASLSDDSPILLPSPPIVAVASAAASPLPPSPNTAATPSARMLYGAPTSQSNKPDKFNLERLALALCRKLHNEGL